MVALIVLAFAMTFLAVPMRTFLPVFAKDIFHRGPETYALFLSVMGCGSIVGSLTVAAMGNVSNKGRVALGVPYSIHCQQCHSARHQQRGNPAAAIDFSVRKIFAANAFPMNVSDAAAGATRLTSPHDNANSQLKNAAAIATNSKEECRCQRILPTTLP